MLIISITTNRIPSSHIFMLYFVMSLRTREESYWRSRASILLLFSITKNYIAGTQGIKQVTRGKILFNVWQGNGQATWNDAECFKD